MRDIIWVSFLVNSMFTFFQSRFLTIFVALALVFSFGVHSIELSHEHPGHGHLDGSYHPGEKETVLSLNEYIHGQEQKLFLAILLATLLIGSLLRPSFLNSSIETFVQVFTLKLGSVFVSLYKKLLYFTIYLVCLFQKGVLNPKLY